MIGRLNHVGIAVPSIEDAKATYRDLYGVPADAITETKELPAQGVKFAFVNVANSQIELIEPLGDESPIRNFLEKNPKGGQHHVCFEVADIYVARDEMDINYFGLLRLAQEFGPALKGRAADGVTGAIAWVNLLSIYALANFPPHGTYSASKAAALSLAQCLRAEMRPAGIRVMNVFPGPIDDEWNQLLPPPKLAPAALARGIVGALRHGIEDLYPGDVAQEWLERWRDNPKVLERELSLGGG